MKSKEYSYKVCRASVIAIALGTICIVLTSCAKEPCTCELNTYRNVDITSYELINSEAIPCTPEDIWKDDDGVTFYKIECN